MGKVKIPLDKTQELASQIVTKLAPVCQRIEVAGSIRRKRLEVGDIEIVYIPLMQVNLFGDEGASLLNPQLEILAGQGSITKGDKWGLKYKKLHLPELPELGIDLFITTADEWGYTFTIRTGSANFSHRLVTYRQYGGLLPGHLRVSECRVWAGDTLLETKEEVDFLSALEVDWIAPKDRV